MEGYQPMGKNTKRHTARRQGAGMKAPDASVLVILLDGGLGWRREKSKSAWVKNSSNQHGTCGEVPGRLISF